VNEARLKQLSLLDEGSQKSLPKDIEDLALDLLVQLLIGVIPTLEEGSPNEQNNC
jgi:hypothetical protein